MEQILADVLSAAEVNLPDLGLGHCERSKIISVQEFAKPELQQHLSVLLLGILNLQKGVDELSDEETQELIKRHLPSKA